MKNEQEDWPPLIPRRRAPEYLSKVWGIETTYHGLGVAASRGGGPAYRFVLGRAVSTPAQLDEYAKQLLSGPALNTGAAHKDAKRKMTHDAA